MEFEFEFNSIQFNYWIKIQFKRNGMQIYGEDIENLLAIMLLERKKKTLIRHGFEKTPFHTSWEWAKQISIQNYSNENHNL